MSDSFPTRALSPGADPEEIMRRSDDLEFLLELCRGMIAGGSIQPFCFRRAVELLTARAAHAEALILCDYVRNWCRAARQSWDGRSAMIWLRPGLQDCIAAMPRLRAALDRESRGLPLAA